MGLSNMQVFDQYVMPATQEILAQEIQKFNAASGGAIVLTSEGFDGNYLRESFFSSLAAARRRVDRNASNSAVTAVDLEELERTSVKVAGGFGPVLYEPSQMTWLQRPTQEGVQLAAEAFAELLLQDQLNTAIACVVAATSNQEKLTNDVSGGANVSYGSINGAHALFGDQSFNLRADVMTGAMAHKLVGQNLTNAERLFRADGVNVVDILGKAAIITDAPALVDGSKDIVISLVANAVIVNNVSDVITNVETTNGKGRIETTFQADYSFGVGVKGYAWDTASGGASPTDEALATGANWNKVTGFEKMTAGVVTIGDA